MKFKNLFFVIIGLSSFTFQTSETCTLQVKIHNLRNLKGQMILEIYDQKKNYVDHPMARFVKEKTLTKNDTLTFYIKGLKKGQYAAAILDDQNKDDKMEFSMLHLPLEGFGFSNNIQATLLGKPAYEDVLFSVPENKEIKI